MQIDKNSLRHYFFAIVALTIACVLAYILISIARDDAGSFEQIYQGVPLDDRRLLELDKQALEDAYKEHARKLWGVYLSDGAKVTDYINRGLRIQREAYAQAAARLVERERLLREKGK